MPATKSLISPVIHTSKPTANSKGGVEYVELSGPEVTRVIVTHGVKHLLDSVGLGHVQPWQVFLSNNGYNDARTFCLRVKRDVAEGWETAPKAEREPASKPAWSPAGVVNTPTRRSRR